MAEQKAPAKGNAGDNIEQFGYKQELRRGMGLWDVVMYGVLFMVIIAPQSIFGSIQQNSHGMTPLVYIIGFVAIMFTAMSYMRMSGRFPIAGSVYSYVQRGINPHVGFIAGWLILLDYILVPSLLIVMVMNWGTALIPNSPAWLWAVVFIAFNTFVNIRGIQMSRGVDWVIFVIEVLAVIAFIALGCNFIMGGGGVAFDCAFTARRLGAENVHVICLEKAGEMRAPAEDLELAAKEGVHVHNSCTMSAIRTEGDKVTGVDYFEVKDCHFDEKGKLTLEAVPDGKHVLECDTVIFAVGMKTDLAFLGENAGGLELTPRNWIKVDESQRTSKAGVFAAGDVSAGPASIARAVGDGRRAAFAVHQMLTGTSSRVYALNEENMIEDCDAMGSDTAPYVVQYADIYGIAQYESVPSEKEAENACTKAFAELNLGLTIEQARKEAARCFHCGHCKACGTCVEDCPGYVLEMRPYQEAERPEMVHGEECWHCANCRTSCPCSAIGFIFPLFMQV